MYISPNGCMLLLGKICLKEGTTAKSQSALVALKLPGLDVLFMEDTDLSTNTGQLLDEQKSAKQTRNATKAESFGVCWLHRRYKTWM